MAETSKAPIVLVDGSNFMYRAFHVPNLARLTNGRGEPTGVLYGVINMLGKLFETYRPEKMAVVFDAKGPSFRNEMYPEYKAHRPPMPDELRSQIEPLHKLIELLGLPILVIDGVEADDVMGTLATEATAKGIDTIIATGDKDMAQLVSDHVRLVDTMKDKVFDREGVIEKFGVPPELIIDLLGLMGDSSDNIPGVPKVGEKTALALIQGLGSIRDIYANLDKVAELDFRGARTMPERLEENRAMAELSHELVTIKTDCDLPVHLEDLHRKEVDLEGLIEFFRDYGFKTWLEKAQQGKIIFSSQGQAAAAPATTVKTESAPVESAEPIERLEPEYEIILEQKQLDRWLKRLEQAAYFAFDTETTSLDYMQARIVGVSFSVETGKAAYLPLAHDYAGAPEQLDREQTLEQLRPLLEDPQHAKVGQNLKYDASVLANHGITLRGIRHDTMLESYVFDSTSRHDMDSLCEKYLNHTTIHFEDIAGKGKNQLTFNQIGLDEAGPYAAEDAEVTLRLHHVLWPKLKRLAGQRELYETIEIPLVPVLSRMERTGVLVDADLLHQQSSELTQRIEELEIQAHDVAGEVFNLGSPKQLQTILFEKMELPVVRKTPKGQPSTAEDVLQELALDYDLPRLILEHRSLSKLKSTYADKLPQQVDPDTGRVHTSYHQAVAATGRLSSSDPNLQNIPIRTREGRRIRQAFIAPEGRVILAADYSQIELRIMAHLSGDKGLLQAFAEGKDIHRATASEVFGVGVKEVSDDQRRAAKAINFGLIYGMSAFGLAKQLGISRGVAQEYVDLYFARYPEVRVYMDDTRELAREQGYVETLFGRRLYLPEINARNGQRRQYAERTAINAPMQGTAADIIKRAMITVDEWVTEHQDKVSMIMQVHDELVFEVEKGFVDQARKEIIELMSSAARLDVPLVVEAGVGANWDEAH
jgi:DNA polymerase-1